MILGVILVILWGPFPRGIACFCPVCWSRVPPKHRGKHVFFSFFWPKTGGSASAAKICCETQGAEGPQICCPLFFFSCGVFGCSLPACGCTRACRAEEEEARRRRSKKKKKKQEEEEEEEEEEEAEQEKEEEEEEQGAPEPEERRTRSRSYQKKKKKNGEEPEKEEQGEELEKEETEEEGEEEE